MRRSPLKARPHQRKQAGRTEKQLAQILDGKAVPSSGAIAGLKGDVSTDKFLIDSKETGSKSIAISAGQLNKISKEAREAGKRPALVITLGRVALGTSRQWAMIPLNDFREIANNDN